MDGKKKIIIFAERNIVRGEEVTYDYKVGPRDDDVIFTGYDVTFILIFQFPSEDIKIPCLCGSEKCRKWMN